MGSGRSCALSSGTTGCDFVVVISSVKTLWLVSTGGADPRRRCRDGFFKAKSSSLLNSGPKSIVANDSSSASEMA